MARALRELAESGPSRLIFFAPRTRGFLVRDGLATPAVAIDGYHHITEAGNRALTTGRYEPL